MNQIVKVQRKKNVTLLTVPVEFTDKVKGVKYMVATIHNGKLTYTPMIQCEESD